MPDSTNGRKAAFLFELFRRGWPALLLAAVALLLLVPNLQGRAWNAIGVFPFNTLNPPQDYTGPVPEVQITAESWGASGGGGTLGGRVRARHSTPPS